MAVNKRKLSLEEQLTAAYEINGDCQVVISVTKSGAEIRTIVFYDEDDEDTERSTNETLSSNLPPIQEVNERLHYVG